MKNLVTMPILKTSFIATLAVLAFVATDLASAQGRKGFGKNHREQSAAESEKRRAIFDEAMKKIEAAELKQAEAKALEAKRVKAAAAAQKALREAVKKEAEAVAAGANREADQRRASAAAFGAAAAAKVSPELRPKFEPPAANAAANPVAPKGVPEGAPQGGVPVEGHGPAPGDEVSATADRGEETRPETVIDADGRVIFDGSGRFGKGYQVVIFEDNVRVTHPDFVMTSDRLTAYFKQPENAPAKDGESPDPGGEEAESSGKKLERAVASGREVTVRKKMEGGEDQIAKARKVTYFADRDEVMLEIWPQVQRGQNLVIAKSKDTIIVLKGEEMVVNGPVRTLIAGKGMVKPGATSEDGQKGGDAPAAEKKTVIDAERGAVFNRPSVRTGEKEVFFEGKVSVSEPGFGIFGDDLTAYLRRDSKTGNTEMIKAVVRGKKAEVQQSSGSEQRFGRANRIVFVTASGDVRLEDQPEVFRGGEWLKGGGVVVMNKDTKDFRQTGGDQRSKMSFLPGASPPG